MKMVSGQVKTHGSNKDTLGAMTPRSAQGVAAPRAIKGARFTPEDSLQPEPETPSGGRRRSGVTREKPLQFDRPEPEDNRRRLRPH